MPQIKTFQCTLSFNIDKKEEADALNVLELLSSIHPDAVSSLLKSPAIKICQRKQAELHARFKTLNPEKSNSSGGSKGQVSQETPNI